MNKTLKVFLSFTVTVVMITVGAVVVVENSLSKQVPTIGAAQNGMGGILANMDSVATNNGTYHVVLVGHTYSCFKKTHSHMKINVYMYANETLSIAFYFVCTAINACSGAHINSRNAVGVKSTIYTSTESLGEGNAATGRNLSPVSVSLNETCSAPYEKIRDLSTGSLSSRWSEEYCIVGTTYNQFTTVIAERYTPNSVISGQIMSIGNTTYYSNGGFLGRTLHNCENSQTISIESGCLP